MLLQISGKLLVLANYEINKEYIANNLCENKAKPKMHCDGKCHLAKELKKEEKKEQSQSNTIKEESGPQNFPEPFSFKPIPVSSQVAGINTIYTEKPYSTVLCSVFHPPRG